MKKLMLLFSLLAMVTVAMAQDEDYVDVRKSEPLILPGEGHINVENLNKKINLKMDISKLSVLELRVLRNAFAARQGYLFNSSELRGIFNTTTWYDSLCWERYDNQSAPPVKYTAKETEFVNKLKAREEELLSKNFVNPNGLVNVDNLINPLQLRDCPDILRNAFI